MAIKIPAFCIDNKNRPKEVNPRFWINEGTEYTIIHVFGHPKQNNISGVLLEEVRMDATCAPYETYRLSRFAIPLEHLPQLIELCKLCTDLNDFDIQKLIEEEEIVTIEN